MSYVDPTTTVGSAWCWWPLNISFDHQDLIKSDRISNTIVVFCFKIHLVPLVLGDHCLCRKTIQIHQESSTRGKWSKVGRPHQALPDVAPLVPPHQSMGVDKKHTLNLIPPLVASRFKIKGSKDALHGFLDPPWLCRWSNGLGSFTPTLYTTSSTTT